MEGNDTPRQPSLRASCDACGMAKLKCDKTRPRCGRCVSLGVDCVYGVCRRSNKRSVTAMTDQPPRSRHSDPPAFTLSTFKASEHTPIVNPQPTWPPLDQHDHLNMATASMAPPSMPIGSVFPDTRDSANNIMGPPLGGLDDWLLPDDGAFDRIAGLFSLPPSTLPTAAPSPAPQPPVSAVAVTDTSDYSSASPPKICEESCGSEAQALLNRLSFMKYFEQPNLSPKEASDLASTHPEQPSFDQILQHTRSINDQLAHILVCHCSRSPYLAFLCASIYTRVLTCYIIAAESDQVARRDSVLSPERSVTIEALSVDDFRVQRTMNSLIVSRELTRARSIVDLFGENSRKRKSGPEGHYPTCLDTLYRHLHSWVKGEHERATGKIKTTVAYLSSDCMYE